MKEVVLQSHRLKVTLAVPDGNERDTTRFDAACRVKSIILNDQYEMCEPEQYIGTRVTSNGFGMSSEFVMCDSLAEVKKGEKFVKLGIGILTQTEDGKAYDIFGDYECIPAALSYSNIEDEIVFTERYTEADGVTPYAVIMRSLRVRDNTIILTTKVMNVGTRKIEAKEYQHNFFSIEHKNIGPGYHIFAPFVANFENVNWEFSMLDEKGKPIGPVPNDPVRREQQTLSWDYAMSNDCFFTSIDKKDLLRDVPYRWMLLHDSSPVIITEDGDFYPDAFSIWGVEHVASCEVFADISLAPGAEKMYTRTWSFSA